MLLVNELQRLFPTHTHERIVTTFTIRFTRVFQIAFAHHRILNADIGMNLIRRGLRTRVSLVLDSGEPREVHHFALLVGYGVSAIHPYLALETVRAQVRRQFLPGLDEASAVNNYLKAGTKGLVKVLSKMGISTMQSYQGAQIFEAVGIGSDLIDRYFCDTPSRIGGIGLDAIARTVNTCRQAADDPNQTDPGLDSGGQYRWRSQGEEHLFNQAELGDMLKQAAEKEKIKYNGQTTAAKTLYRDFTAKEPNFGQFQSHYETYGSAVDNLGFKFSEKVDKIIAEEYWPKQMEAEAGIPAGHELGFINFGNVNVDIRNICYKIEYDRIFILDNINGLIFINKLKENIQKIILGVSIYSLFSKGI